MLWTVLQGGISSIYSFLFLLFGYLVLLFVMMPVHEAAHAWIAVKLGDGTPRWYGRLTLNPLAHLDPLGSLMIVLFGIGYAKPVPVNPHNFQNRRRGMALTALAGPVSNLLMAFLSVGVYAVLYRICQNHIVTASTYENIELWVNVLTWSSLILIHVLAAVNISLAVFNLLPLPPLDGSRIFGAILPPKWSYWMDCYHQYVRMAVLLLVVTGVLDGPLHFLQTLVGNGMCAMFRLPNLF